MSVKIHPTAIVDSKALIESGVEVGPYSLIGPHVKIGKNTKIASHAVIQGYTEIGRDCSIYSGACLGSEPQVRKTPERSYLKIGNQNIIREYVTMNPGMHEEASTVVGDKNFIMINVHIAHDCRIGSEVTIANAVGLAGHVTIEDKVVVGGLVGVHQFVRIGQLAMIGGVSKVVSDVPPFVTADGHPAKFHGVNTVGLRRSGYSAERIRIIRQALKILLGSGLSLPHALEKTTRELGPSAELYQIIEFLKVSKRPIIRGVVAEVAEEV